MKQIDVILLGAREDYQLAMNMCTLVHMNKLSYGVEGVMLARIIALDWCKWIKDPKTVPENHPMKEKDIVLLAPFIDIFERCVKDLEQDLIASQSDFADLCQYLNGSLIRFWRSNDPLIKESAKMYHRTLRLTAKFFDEKSGDNHFNDILKEKLVPPMS